MISLPLTVLEVLPRVLLELLGRQKSDEVTARIQHFHQLRGELHEHVILLRHGIHRHFHIRHTGLHHAATILRIEDHRSDRLALVRALFS